MGESVAVVTGVGGMGEAVARRIGPGRHLVLADIEPAALDAVADRLRADGFRVTGCPTDVSDPDSVDALGRTAAGLGPIEAVVHTAGVSPVQATVAAILRVDLLGTAWMLDTFGALVAPGGAGVFVASMAGTMAGPDTERDERLATTPAAALLDLPELGPERITDPGTAYVLAKRANQVRVRAASVTWGRRRARVNSISPGVISTPMGAAELQGASGDVMRAMVAASAAGRIGTAQEIASAAAFLLGPDASYVTGTDLLVDGGVIAGLHHGAG
jgi:NAD(P)-dependent dehydrogenase (short-subunit alcohol dehydrogenase family)